MGSRALGRGLILGVLAGLAACRGGAAGPADLTGLDALKARFNHDVGATRIVLLLSPT